MIVAQAAHVQSVVQSIAIWITTLATVLEPVGERVGEPGPDAPAPAASQPTVSQPTVSQPTASQPTVSQPTEPEAHGPTMLLWSEAASTDDPGWAIRIRRVQAELEALGVHTMLFVPPPGRGSASAVAREMAARGATIAVWVAVDRDRAELWRLDSQRLIHVAIVTGEEVGDEGDTTFAVRCAEVAHALSVQIEPTPRGPPPATLLESPESPDHALREHAPRWDARVGASLGGAARDVGLLLGPHLGGGVRLGARRRLGLDADLGVTALRGRVSGTAGQARLGWFIARAHVGVWPVPGARVSPMAGLGGGVLVAWTRGDGVAPFRGRSDVTQVALVSAALDVAVRLTARLRLRVGARVGVALPPIVIDTGGAEHRTALPTGELTVALDVNGRRSQ